MQLSKGGENVEGAGGLFDFLADVAARMCECSIFASELLTFKT